ncbi:MAG: pyridoxamine kinase [Bacteroidales bacterium]|nr:pyridoxamine kinase [Clostridium sp.]MCM1204548.1 pyridoxamine kinase [Bacteroidales bacterium]
MNKQTSIAIVNDISGFGRCSVTVALPILSAMQIQCGIVPTAVLSNHTGYPDYSLLDFTPYMNEYLEKWDALHFSFDGIYTGFLGSEKQLSTIIGMFNRFSFTKRIVDPVMGDDGMLYDSYTEEMCHAMKQLVAHSTLTTPNLTELCLLTDRPYHKEIPESDILDMCKTLVRNGAGQIVVTGIEKENLIGNAIYENGNFELLYEPKIYPPRPGTGDVFSSILAGGSLHNTPLRESVITASRFIRTCLITSSEINVPLNDGVCFELHLDMLTHPG